MIHRYNRIFQVALIAGLLTLTSLFSPFLSADAHAAARPGECQALEDLVDALEDELGRLRARFALESAECQARYADYQTCANACGGEPRCVDENCLDEYVAYGNACHQSALTNQEIEDVTLRLQSARAQLAECRGRRIGEVVGEGIRIFGGIRGVIGY